MSAAHSIVLALIALTIFAVGVAAGVLGTLERTDERQNLIDERVRALVGRHDGAESEPDHADD